MNDSIIQTTAENLGMEPSEVAAVIDEFMLQLHRAQFERNEERGGDYMAVSQMGTLFRALPRQAYFHFLGFYEIMQRAQGSWETGYAREYLARLALRSEWLPFSHQMSGWKKGSYWVGR